MKAKTWYGLCLMRGILSFKKWRTIPCILPGKPTSLARWLGPYWLCFMPVCEASHCSPLSNRSPRHIGTNTLQWCCIRLLQKGSSFLGGILLCSASVTFFAPTSHVLCFTSGEILSSAVLSLSKCSSFLKPEYNFSTSLFSALYNQLIAITPYSFPPPG